MGKTGKTHSFKFYPLEKEHKKNMLNTNQKQTRMILMWIHQSDRWKIKLIKVLEIGYRFVLC